MWRINKKCSPVPGDIFKEKAKFLTNFLASDTWVDTFKKPYSMQFL